MKPEIQQTVENTFILYMQVVSRNEIASRTGISTDKSK
jgi:hypothetical protein